MRTLTSRYTSAEPFTAAQVFPTPHTHDLRHAAESIFTSWFLLRGFHVDEPRRSSAYDLVVRNDSLVKRVQVKSTTHKDNGNWLVNIGRRPTDVSKNVSRNPYAGDLFDWFAILDGDMAMYVIPYEDVAGHMTLTMSGYQVYRVGSAASLGQ
jgi:hypothetical protein